MALRIDNRVWTTPAERRERVIVAGKARGLVNMEQIANHIDMYPASLSKALSRENASVLTIIRICQGLGITLDFVLKK